MVCTGPFPRASSRLPRWHDGRLWLLESGTGQLALIDPISGRRQTVTELPGFTRGLAFAGPYAFIGLSKIPRVIDVLSKRPQMQERLTEELAELLMRELDAKGVAVVIEASHSCMTVRGVKKPESTFVTSAMRGGFRERLATRTEVMSLIFGHTRS